MEKNFIKVGFINVKDDDYVIVGDPCYDMDATFIDVVNVKRGMYDCYIEKKDCGRWGNRVSRLAILKDSYGVDRLNHSAVLSWNVGVDSGRMGIYPYGFFEYINEDNERKDNWYDHNVCGDWKDYLLKNNEFILSTSGYGDGNYDVYVYYDDSEMIIGVEVVFIEDNDYDEDND
jgi:hypothetical protein